MPPVDSGSGTNGRTGVLSTVGIGSGVRRSVDPRAVLPGAAVVGAVVAGVYLSSLPVALVVLGAPLGGAVTGWLSRTFESEGFDGAMATLLGTVVAFAVAAAAVWIQADGILVSAKLLVAAAGALVAVLFGLVTMVVGGAVAHGTAAVRRQVAFVDDPVPVRSSDDRTRAVDTRDDRYGDRHGR